MARPPFVGYCHALVLEDNQLVLYYVYYCILLLYCGCLYYAIAQYAGIPCCCRLTYIVCNGGVEVYNYISEGVFQMF